MYLRQLRNNITLVSASPMRKQILLQLGCTPLVLPAAIKERSAAIRHKDYVLEIAQKKLQSVLPQIQTPYALSADTIIVVKRIRLGKPLDAHDARRMIALLSGTKHRVYTALCFYSGKIKTILHTVASATLGFRTLTPEEINSYIESETWRGVAGAYKLQENGHIFIKSLRGAPSTVLGLPVHRMEYILKKYIRTNKISHL